MSRVNKQQHQIKRKKERRKVKQSWRLTGTAAINTSWALPPPPPLCWHFVYVPVLALLCWYKSCSNWSVCSCVLAFQNSNSKIKSPDKQTEKQIHTSLVALPLACMTQMICKLGLCRCKAKFQCSQHSLQQSHCEDDLLAMAMVMERLQQQQRKRHQKITNKIKIKVHGLCLD